MDGSSGPAASHIRNRRRHAFRNAFNAQPNPAAQRSIWLRRVRIWRNVQSKNDAAISSARVLFGGVGGYLPKRRQRDVEPQRDFAYIKLRSNQGRTVVAISP